MSFVLRAATPADMPALERSSAASGRGLTMELVPMRNALTVTECEDDCP